MAVRRQSRVAIIPDGHPKARTQPARSSVRAAAGRVARRVRGRHLLFADVVGVVLACAVAVTIRFDGRLDTPTVLSFVPIVALIVLVRSSVGVVAGLYSRDWRSASTPDMERILAAVSAGSIVALAIWMVGLAFGAAWAVVVPRTFWLAEMVMSLTILGGLRFGVRVASEWRPTIVHQGGRDVRATLLYGAGQVGARMARSALRDPQAGVIPVGFLDDDPTLSGGSVAGIRVFGGLGSLEQAVAATGAHCLLITMPSAPGSAVRRVVDAAAALGLEVRTVPPLSDLLDGSLDAYRIRQVRVEDLLRRPIVSARHDDAVDGIIAEQVVVITGAGGSIGSELARQAFSIGPRRLILLDRAESSLYLVERELASRHVGAAGAPEVVVHLADVADRDAMARMVAEFRPDVIFHAAAYKHVPLMEAYPSAAVRVNAGGTMAVLDAAEQAGVERFVLVSTDKAVRPSSVMGATKRLAEMLVADAARRTGRPYVSVRFGNVLGSSGSVLPVFQAQLEKGEPLTITDPAATRYFMTIPEAAWLILDAAALGQDGGDLFVLDMGDPVLILDLARDLVRLSGRDPDSHPVEVVGLRPGEKLHEQLFYDAEDVESTSSAKVLRVCVEPPPEDIRPTVGRLLGLATGVDDRELRAELLAAVWSPDGRSVDGSDERTLVAIPVVGDAFDAGAAEIASATI